MIDMPDGSYVDMWPGSLEYPLGHLLFRSFCLLWHAAPVIFSARTATDGGPPDTRRLLLVYKKKCPPQPANDTAEHGAARGTARVHEMKRPGDRKIQPLDHLRKHWYP